MKKIWLVIGDKETDFDFQISRKETKNDKEAKIILKELGIKEEDILMQKEGEFTFPLAKGQHFNVGTILLIPFPDGSGRQLLCKVKSITDKEYVVVHPETKI